MNFEYITRKATKPARSWSNKDKVAFHYFNENGLYARKLATDKIISDLVDQGKAKSGAIIAYGSLDGFVFNELNKLHSKQRVSDADLRSWIYMTEYKIELAKEFIAETK